MQLVREKNENAATRMTEFGARRQSVNALWLRSALACAAGSPVSCLVEEQI